MSVPILVVAGFGMATLAVVALGGALLLRARQRHFSDRSAALVATLEERTSRMPQTLATGTERLARLGSDAERTLWSLAQTDAGLERAQERLVAGREGSDALRLRLVDNQRRLTQLRGSARLALRALEMRRTFLG